MSTECTNNIYEPYELPGTVPIEGLNNLIIQYNTKRLFYMPITQSANSKCGTVDSKRCHTPHIVLTLVVMKFLTSYISTEVKE